MRATEGPQSPHGPRGVGWKLHVHVGAGGLQACCTALTGGSDAAGCGFVAIRARRNSANDALRASWLRAHSAVELNACHHRATLGKANLTNLFGPMVSAAPEVSDHLCSNPSSRPPPTASSSPPRSLGFTENEKRDFPKNILTGF